MAIKAEKWEQARLLFELGKSLKDISEATGIDKSTVSKAAKAHGWNKGKNQRLVADAVRVREEISTLPPAEIQQVEKEIDERTRHLLFLNNATLKNVSVMVKKVNEDIEINDHRLVQETINKAADRLLGKEQTVNMTVSDRATMSKEQRDAIVNATIGTG